MGIAFFDMDGTLVDGDTNDISLHFYVQKGLIEESYLEPLKEMGRQFFLGKVDINAVAEFACKPLVDMPKEKREKLLEECVREHIAPRFKLGALKTIKWHNAHNNACVIVTSTNDYLVRHVADALGIRYIIASPMEQDENGILTGRRNGVIPYQQYKVTRIKEFMQEHKFNTDDSWAYGDSVNDVPMLLIARHGVAVDPNPAMREHPSFNRFSEEHWV